MILLEYANRIIIETLRERFSNPITTSLNIADFDGVGYRLSTPESKTLLVVSMRMPCFGELLQYGAMDVLRREYGSMLEATPEPGFEVTLKVDIEKVPQDYSDREALIRKIALLKRNALAAPFEQAFDAQIDGRETPLMAIHYRDTEVFYVKAGTDRVTVIFSTEFKEEQDRILGKVFLQEFVDARRLPQIQNAPQVLYTNRDPPLELRGQPGLKDSENIGYVTFVLFPRHFSKEKREDTISKIQLFRDYLHYHIKCSKSYMHSRMRARVAEFLKVLNRAKPEPVNVEKKTIAGKTFKRS
ncbi:P34-Arc-domain-containing protein [Gonapodya prolifera JEL478]|uniref:Arp2/3 complex 34 kDa subunit n=1 Tax=Gonapodya prolifera (strain JEL478) TaxID=1344416 RepID=A0A139AV21_GONPJ|nr:P34-Arc-domain-containing protein [Gonapodya prolifera JEL478]|eukprot:KXS20557.1 P34-Arc-domain-containing protein [Gonapodya prolifera JEL478]